MSSYRVPPPALLDLLVLGVSDPDLDEDWAALAVATESERAWRTAMERRRRRDRTAQLLTSAEWLASSLIRLRIAMRSARASAQLLGHAGSAPSPLLSNLAPGTPEVVELRAGRTTTLELPLDSVVLVEVAEGVEVSWETSIGHGFLPGRRWKLEAGEAPVLLVAADQQGMKGALVLLERRQAGKT